MEERRNSYLCLSADRKGPENGVYGDIYLEKKLIRDKNKLLFTGSHIFIKEALESFTNCFQSLEGDEGSELYTLKILCLTKCPQCRQSTSTKQ